MLELMLPRPQHRPTRILCLGAHCDDIEIGCGGTLLKLLARRAQTEVTWVVFSATAEREGELRVSARRFLRGARRSDLLVHGYRDSYFPGSYTAIKDSFESLKGLPAPDLIFTHRRADLHQDHRLIGELTWNAFRRHLILEYEIPKYEADPAVANAYVPLTRVQATAKTRNLLGCYPSQHGKPWFRAETFDALMRLRAVEAGDGATWAEAFLISKFNLG